MKPIITSRLCQTAAALLTAFLALRTASTSYAANTGAKIAVVSLGLFGGFVALSLVMAVMTIAGLRRPVSVSTVQLPELTWADRVISLFVLCTFTVAIANALIMVVAKGLP